MKGKKVILVLGRGGMYTEGPMKVMDYQETYLRAVLGFVGITDIDTVLIEGVGMGVEKRARSISECQEEDSFYNHKEGSIVSNMV